MGTIFRSWDLVKKSLAILASDKELVVLPLISTVASVMAAGGLFGWYFWSNWAEIQAAHAAHSALPYQTLLYLLTFTYYVISYFAVVFCNVALIAVANNRMGGGNWTLSRGLEFAWERKGAIFQWAVFAATVGMILRYISERVGLLGKIVVGLIGLAWSLAIYFVVPVLAFENLGPVDALKRSASLFRKTWGERAVAAVSFGLIFALPMIVVGAIWFWATVALVHSAAGAFIAFGVLGLMVLLTACASSAATSIFNVALYNYAMSGRVHGGFTEDDFMSAWQPKS